MSEDFLFRDIVESAHDVIIITETVDGDVRQQQIVYVNTAFTSITGYTREEALGKRAKLLELIDDEEKKSALIAAMEQKQPAKVLIKSRTKSGDLHWLNTIIVPIKGKDANQHYFASIERDVTKEQQLLEKLEKLSQTDPLTGLLNRRAFHDLAQAEIARYQRSKTPFCLLMIDLDYFKKINDTYGHATGDKMLQLVAENLSSQEREYDYVARTGGEEFCILLANTKMENAGKVAGRIKSVISEIHVKSDEGQVGTTASIGIAEFTELDANLHDIMKRADEALYHAKASGRNCVVTNEAVTKRVLDS